jgi:hypothetical protein
MHHVPTKHWLTFSRLCNVVSQKIGLLKVSSQLSLKGPRKLINRNSIGSIPFEARIPYLPNTRYSHVKTFTGYLETVMASLSISRRTPEYYHKLGDNYFLPHLFQFTIHSSPHHFTL